MKMKMNTKTVIMLVIIAVAIGLYATVKLAVAERTMLAAAMAIDTIIIGVLVNSICNDIKEFNN